MAQPFSIAELVLIQWLFQPGAPRLLDIRIAEDRALDPGALPASIALPFDDLTGRIDAAKARASVVVVCQGGLKLSQATAARLAERGVAAGFLAGGLAAWRGAALPLWQGEAAARWIAPWTPEPQTCVARWLVQRLLPHASEVILVAPDQIDAATKPFGATVLPPPDELFRNLDRALPQLTYALDFAESAGFAALCEGHAARLGPQGHWFDAIAGDLDALVARRAVEHVA
ncbi:MAG: rhodanese-like domain-containing protein [Pseudomonadota bacterium]